MRGDLDLLMWTPRPTDTVEPWPDWTPSDPPLPGGHMTNEYQLH